MVTATNNGQAPLKLADGTIIEPNQTVRFKKKENVMAQPKLIIDGRTLDFELPRFIPGSLGAGTLAHTGILEDNSLILEARKNWDTARDAASKALDLAQRVMDDETQTVVARHIAVKDRAMKIIWPAFNSLNKTSDTINSEISRLGKATTPGKSDATQAIIASADAAALRSMEPHLRRQHIATAIKAGDPQIVPLLFHFMPWTSGLEASDQATFRLEWRHSRHPSEMAAIGELDRIGDWTGKSAALLWSFHQKLFSPVAVERGQRAREAAAA